MGRSAQKISEKLASIFSAQAKAVAELRADLDGIEGELIAAQNRRAETLRRPVPRDEIERRVDSFLALHEAEGREALNAATFAGANYSVNAVNVADAFNSSRTGFGAFLALFGRETVRAALVREAVAASTGESITEFEREAEVTRLTREIETLERIRERVVRDGEQHGIAVPRSEFADPAVLLAPDGDL